MKGDFSNLRFTPDKNYTAVLQQQGRVALDSDANEQSAIQDYLRETETRDVIGRFGGPRSDEGFAITAPSGQSIQIGQGRYYVEGILCDQQTDVAYSQQPFLANPTPTDAALLNQLTQGEITQILLTLQVWQRLVTALDDPCLREPAIGPADTTARLQTVWRVVAEPSQNDPKPKESCCRAEDWVDIPRFNQGKLSATTAGPGGDCSCQPTPAAGYRGIENQLYRIEIHQGGDESSATFKWSRENASIVSAITNFAGNVVTVSSLGFDANLGFNIGDWVEISDDSEEFGLDAKLDPNLAGKLYKITDTTPSALTVTLDQTPAAVDVKLHPRIRRWDQKAGTTSDGIPLTTATFTLENGIEIQFSRGNYQTGDYWLIPARTATGQLEWPPCGSNGDPFQPGQFIQIHKAPLAAIYLKDGNLFVDDLRRKFPPLSCISASDVCYDPRACSNLAAATNVQQALDLLCSDHGPCTIVPKPGPGWELPILALKPGADADICFPVGEFPLSKVLWLQHLGNIRMTGGGPGTRIIGERITAAMQFTGCKSIQISDLSATTSFVTIRRLRKGETPQLGGTLSFVDCLNVTVENVQLRCGYGEERTAACIAVQNTYLPPVNRDKASRLNLRNNRTGFGEVRIRHCNLSVGRNQEGILLVRVGRAMIEDNILQAYLPRWISFRQRMENRYFRANALRAFIANTQYVKATSANQAPAPKSAAEPTWPTAAANARLTVPVSVGMTTPSTPTEKLTDRKPARVSQLPVKSLRLNTTVTAGGHTLSFQTHPLLKDFWPAYLAQNGPESFATSRDLLLYMKKASLDFLLHPKTRIGNSAISSLISELEKADQVAMSRGISVGGEGIADCRILNNSITDAVQGITVGMSNHQQEPFQNDWAGQVTISGNHIYVGLPPGVLRHACHGIFAGNVDSLMIENNFCQALTTSDPVNREGIRVFGYLGRRMIIRHCHLIGFQTGLMIYPLPTNEPQQQPLWFVGENMAEGSFPTAIETFVTAAQNSITLSNNLS